MKMLNLMYITNRPLVAEVADRCGVDRIMVDLERLGKAERQRGWNSIISDHSVSDIEKVKKNTKNAEIIVRVNPINPESRREIDEVTESGADIIMLPYFKTPSEAESFLSYVDGRCKTSLLLETKEAVDCLDSILSIGGADEFHIGLNDLSHSYGASFLFEMFPMGVVDKIVAKFKNYGVTNYGIGGIAKLNCGLVPAEDVIAEHYRLGSKRAILSRAFCNADKLDSIDEIESLFIAEVARIRRLEKYVSEFDPELLERCRKSFNKKVEKVAQTLAQREAFI